MEVLQKITRKQLVVLQLVHDMPDSPKGISLKSIASRLKIRPPSALELIKTLESLGLVSRKSGKTRLSRSGIRCLEEYNRHHRIAEILFSHYLGPEESHLAANAVDLSISHEVVDKICAAEGHPKVCPHGNQIPECGGEGEAV